MNENIIATMEAEEAELSQKLDAVRQFLAVYRKEAGSIPSVPTKAAGTKATRAPRTLEDRMDKFGPYGQRIVDYSEKMLPGCDDNPMPTRLLVEALEAHGLSITGNNKVNSLSALLARSSKMKGWGRAGWTRAIPEDGELFERNTAPSRNENGATEAAPEADEAPTSSIIPHHTNPTSGMFGRT